MESWSNINERDVCALLRLLRELADASGGPAERRRVLEEGLAPFLTASQRDPRLEEVIRREMGLSGSNGKKIGASSPPLPVLAPRYRRVLDQLLDGASEKQIARTFNLSPHTVHEYVKRIYRAFGVQSRGELLARWIEKSGQAGPAAGSARARSAPVPV